MKEALWIFIAIVLAYFGITRYEAWRMQRAIERVLESIEQRNEETFKKSKRAP